MLILRIIVKRSYRTVDKVGNVKEHTPQILKLVLMGLKVGK